MTFFDLGKEERDDWRRHPVTLLALKALREAQEQAEHDSLDATRRGAVTDATVLAGKATGIQDAIELLEKDG